MALFGRRNAEPISIASEQERLRAIRIAAEDELGRLRSELTERVAAVEQRERELADAISRVSRGASRQLPAGDDVALAHARVGLAAHAQELKRRENELAAREHAYLKMERDLARRAADVAQTPEERLAQIEERLVALQKAEQSFARTQAELAARSEELTQREAVLAEAALAGGAMLGAGGTSRAEMAEIDERLRRLERETREAASERTFGDALRTLERKGLRGTPPNG